VLLTYKRKCLEAHGDNCRLKKENTCGLIFALVLVNGPGFLNGLVLTHIKASILGRFLGPNFRFTSG